MAVIVAPFAPWRPARCGGTGALPAGALAFAPMRPTLHMLSDELIGQIVDEAKRVLAETGMEIRGPEMRRRLLEAGLPTNAGGDRVLFPRDVVERAIATAPSSFVLYDRHGLPHADLGGDRVHFVPGSSGLKWLDHRTGDVRLADSTDFVEYVRLADGLTNIAYLATAFSTNADIEAQVSDAWRLYLTLTNSRKPVVSDRNARRVPSSLTPDGRALMNFCPSARAFTSSVTSSVASSVPFFRQWIEYCLPSMLFE